MENPNRFIILAITTILFMITATLYGEGLRREKLEQAAKQPVSESVVPVPVPVPVPHPHHKNRLPNKIRVCCARIIAALDSVIDRDVLVFTAMTIYSLSSRKMRCSNSKEPE